RAHAEKDRIEFADQVLECEVAADLDAQAEFDSHVLHDLAALVHHLFFELERRYAEGQQAADLRMAVEHHGGHAAARQHVRAGEAGGAGADDRDALAGTYHVRQIGLPALLERFVRDVLFDGADAHRADAVVQGARAFAQPVLRTDSTAHLGQRIGWWESSAASNSLPASIS